MSTDEVRSNDTTSVGELTRSSRWSSSPSDVDRAKEFYGSLGWRRDADYGIGDDFRVIQFTPPALPMRNGP